MNCFRINLNSTVRVSLSSKEHLIPPRGHITRRAPTYILYFVTAGVLRIKLNGEDFTLNRGDIYIFKPGDMHAPAELTDCEYFYLHFEADLAELELAEDEMLQKIKERNRLFSSYEILDLRRYEHFFALLPQKMHVDDGEGFDFLVNEFRKIRLNVWDVGIERRLEISQGAASLFVSLERMMLNAYLSQSKDGRAQTLAAVKQIADYVESNYTGDISAEDIERHFSLSYDYANRLFKQQKGTSIIAYRNRLRIEKAKMLLLTTEKSVEQIADETGFGDKYYFSKFFKKAVGVSPTHFKRGEHFAN